MSQGILDTSVLVADVTLIPGELAIGVVSLDELYFAVLAAENDQTRANRLSHVSVIQRRFDALPIDDAVADSYGRPAARVAEVGRQPRARVTDLLIAATAGRARLTADHVGR